MKCPQCKQQGEVVFVPRRITNKDTFHCDNCDSYYNENGMYTKWESSQSKETKQEKKE